MKDSVIPVNPFRWFFLQSQEVSLLAYAVQEFGEHPGGSSADLWSSLSVQLSPLWYSVLQILAVLAFPYYQVLLNSERSTKCTYVLPFCSKAWTHWTHIKLGNHKAHLVCVPYLRGHCASLPNS